MLRLSAQERDHVRAELLEEALLVVPGRVEDQVVEAERDVVADPLRALLRGRS